MKISLVLLVVLLCAAVGFADGNAPASSGTGAAAASTSSVQPTAAISPTLAKLPGIGVANITLRNTPLDLAVSMLAEISQRYDPAGKGVNIVVVGAATEQNPYPLITLKLRNVTLETVLKEVCAQSGYDYDVESGIVTLRPVERAANAPAMMETRDFPLSQSTLIRLTGYP